jgi:hypothetical protein
MNFEAVMDPLRVGYAGIKNYSRNALLSTSLCVGTTAFAPIACRLAARNRGAARGAASHLQIHYGSLYILTLIAKIRIGACAMYAPCIRNANKYAACSGIVQDAT